MEVNPSIELKSRNEEIAKMLGWFQDEDKDVWFKKTDCSIIVAFNKNIYRDCLPFDNDWNYLMEAFEFIKKKIKRSNYTEDLEFGEFIIDRVDIGLNSIYIEMAQWTKEGWKRERILYDERHDCMNFRDCMFHSISDVAMLLNKPTQ